MHSDDSILGRFRPPHAGSHHHSMGRKLRPPGARVRIPLQRSSMRRRDYHGGNYIYVFFRLNLPLNKFRRQCYKFRRQCYNFRRQCYKFRRQCYKFRKQCYDGVGNMSGQRTCVAKRIQELEPGQSNHILKATR